MLALAEEEPLCLLCGSSHVGGDIWFETADIESNFTLVEMILIALGWVTVVTAGTPLYMK